MASHNYQQFQYGLEKFPVTLYGNIPIGATGAVGTLDPTKNQGIYGVTRSSAGVYVITFGVASQLQIDKYVRVISADAILLNSTVAGLGFEVVADAVASAGTMTVRFTGPTSSSVTTPIAVDPPSGAVILFSVVLKNSSV